MIDDRAPRRGLIHSPHKVHKNCLAGPAPSDNADCFPLCHLKINILEHNGPVELHAEVLYSNKWGHLELLAKLIFSWDHIRVYIIALFLGRRDILKEFGHDTGHLADVADHHIDA